MRAYFVAVMLIAGCGAGLPAWADSTASAPNQRIGKLIKQLGSSRFSERERAQHELETIGEPAVPALQQATKSADLETSRRATDLLRLLEMKSTTARLLAPRRVRLKLKGASSRAAVGELEKQSGYKIQVQGQPSDRTVTLDTGDVTFWEALDQLCAKAGLVEMPVSQPMNGPFQGGFVQPFVVPPALPGGILPVIPPPPPVQPKKGPRLQVQGIGAVPAPVAAPPIPAPKIMPPFPPGGFGGGMVFPMAMATMNQGPIILVPGQPRTPPTCYAGSVRIRLVSVPTNVKRVGEAILAFDVAAEPMLTNFQLDGNPRLDRAVDEHGQTLNLAGEPAGVLPGVGNNNFPAPPPVVWVNNPIMGNRQTTMRLKLGDKEAKTLKELKGLLTAKALTPTEALITVNDILQAGGKTVKGAHGGSIQIQSVEKTGNGLYQMRIRLEQPPTPNPAGGIQFQQIQMQGGGNVRVRIGGNMFLGGGFPMNPGNNMPSLLDKTGKTYQLAGVPAMSMTFTNGQVTREATLLFRPNNGQEPPDRLVYHGRREVTFQVPFTFKNVPLP